MLAVFLAVLILFFAVQSYSFQTWLGKTAGKYFSGELNTTVSMQSVRIDFFDRASVENLLVLDRHNDTLFYGSLAVNIRNPDLRNQRITLQKISLSGATAKIISYKGEKGLNFGFIEDYFGGGSSDTTKKGWDVKFGEVILDNVSFLYRDEDRDQTVGPAINFDNLRVDHVAGKISGLELRGDTIAANITGLSAIEQSGFRLGELSTKASVSNKQLLCEELELRTPSTFIGGTIRFKYDKWDDYNDFVEKVIMDCSLEDSTHVGLPDIAAFAPELRGLYHNVALSGKVNGSVSDLSLKDFRLAFGQDTYFSGNISLSGLPDYKSAYLHFNAREISTSYHDIVSIPDYPFDKGKLIELPEEIRRLGRMTYRGKFDGFLTDFTTYGTFGTALGRINSQLSIRMGEKEDDISYHGKVSTVSFDLGTLLGQSDLNNLSLTADLKGTGMKLKNIKADLKADISSIAYNKYTYKHININGNLSYQVFKGVMISRDTNANFDFNGTVDFRGKVPEMDFIASIHNLNLSEMNFTGKADSGRVSSQLVIKIHGESIDDMSGRIYLDNTIYKTKTRTYRLSTLSMELDQEGQEKRIALNSADINAVMSGKYRLSRLPAAFETILHEYYPSYFRKPPPLNKIEDEFEYRVYVKKFNTISELFLPGFMLSPGTLIQGNFSLPDMRLNAQLSTSKISYGSFFASDLYFIVNQNNREVIAEVTGKGVHITDSLNIANFEIKVKSLDKAAQYQITWHNPGTQVNEGEISGSVFIEDLETEITNEKLSVTINDSTWTQTAPAKVQIGKSGSVIFSPFEIVNGDQLLRVAGNLSNKKGDSLVLAANNLVLEQFNPVLKAFMFKIEGVMNGDIKFSNIDKNFIFDGDLVMTGFKVNDNTIGELVVRAGYDTRAKQISMDGYTSLGITDEFGRQSKNISFNGYYYLGKKDESLDINFSANPANIRLLNPFLDDILTIKSGFVNGEGKIHGTPENVKIDGKFKIFNSEIKVDYTNVTYNITGDIEVMPDQIRFSDLLLREKGSRTVPQGTVNGNIFHTNFQKMQLDYDITYRNMLVLNTSLKENKDFYGKVYGSGNVGLYGFINNLHMKIIDTTTSGTRFYLPLDSPAEIGESDFIHFVKKDTVKIAKKTLTGFNLDLSVFATPEAKVQIILDYQGGDILNVQGQGQLDLRINTLGKFDMVGTYIITDGDYLFTLEHVINKKFDIEAGSSISWSGNPMNAEIDVVTSYKQRASVAPLLNDTSGRYRARFPVDLKLLISGKLFSPSLTFDIDIPNLDAPARATVNNVLSDQNEMNRQVFSLLLFRSFVTPLIFNTQGGGVTAGGAAASTSSEFLSNRVSSFLNTYFGNLTGIKDLQLGLNYRPGDHYNSEAVDLALSKQFLNNKLAVAGNVGVNNQVARSNGLIGDVSIDYKLSDDGRYRLKGFNRSNDNTQITVAGGPYTQGVGFAYREEFNDFNELFRRYLSKLKKR